MKIVLLQDVPKIGRKNEVKEVSEGFARNFLFARKLAVQASDAELKKLTQAKEKKEKGLTEEKEIYQKLAEKLKTITLNFKMKVGDGGRAFGSVTKNDIQEALQQKGFKIEKDWIDDEHIKTTGEKMVQIRFPQGIEGEVRIIVNAE
ncbi:MAG: 50S ribosomal protein L9 [bacterium]|nr:50S ribosomal protein L9 [bacterium]